jgi:hypothetical protein
MSSKTPIIVLRGIMIFILLGMIALTVVAVREAPLSEAGAVLWEDAWFRLTLADAYFGFLVVYLWVWYKERKLGSRAAWLVLFVTLGNMAVATYILIQLFKVRQGDLAESLLLRGDPR